MLLLGLSFLLRAGAIAGTIGWGHVKADEYHEYRLVGQRFLEQGTITCPLITLETPTAPSALLPPIYGVLVAGVFGLLGTDTITSIVLLQLINVLASTASVGVIFLTAQRIAGLKAAWAAALVMLINPLLIGYNSYIWDTDLFALCVSLTVYFSYRLGNCGSRFPAWMLLFGFWLGGIAQLNPALTLAYPLLVLWPVYRRDERQARLLMRSLGASVIGFIIALTPWTVRNYEQLDRLIYVRDGLMLELWLGACPEADTQPQNVYYARYPLKNETLQRRVIEIGELAFIDESGLAAKQIISEDPTRFMKLVMLRFSDYWAGTFFTRASPDHHGLPSDPVRWFGMIFQQIEFLALIIFVMYYRRWDLDIMVLITTLFLYSLVYCITHVQVRYRVPMEPVLALLIVTLYSRLSSVRSGKSTLT